MKDSSPGAGDGLASLLKHDLDPNEPGSFGVWLLAIVIIGAVGYIPGLKPVSWAFLVLVIVVMFLTNNKANSPGGGFIAQVEKTFGLPGGGVSTSILPTVGGSLNAGHP